MWVTFWRFFHQETFSNVCGHFRLSHWMGWGNVATDILLYVLQFTRLPPTINNFLAPKDSYGFENINSNSNEWGTKSLEDCTSFYEGRTVITLRNTALISKYPDICVEIFPTGLRGLLSDIINHCMIEVDENPPIWCWCCLLLMVF